MNKGERSLVQNYAIYKRKKTNVMYFMYLALGAATFDSSCHATLRRIYFALEAYASIFASVSCLPCLYDAVTADKINIAYLLSVFTGCFVGPVMLMNTLTTYLCRRDFQQAFSLVDHNFRIDWREWRSKDERDGILRRRMNKKRWALIVVVIIGSMTVFCTVSRYVATVLAEDAKQVVRDYRYYIVPFGYARYVDSFIGYSIVYFMQLIMLIIFYTKGTIVVVFLFYLGGTFYNPFVKLAHNLTAEFTKISAETAVDGLRGGNEHFEAGSFRQRCIVYLEDYRKLLRATERIRLYILINYPLNCATVVSYFVPSAFSLLQEEHPLFFKLTSGSTLISLTLYLFACCYIGKIMDDMNEIMTFAVYNVPWYLFGKEDRKFVYMMLCEIQRTHFQIFALKQFRVSMNAFIRILRFNYSIINLLRGMEKM